MRSVTAAALLLLAVAPGCTGRSHAGPAPDPCAGVTCGEHEACIAAGSTGACTCDPGYVRSGAACVASTVPSIGGCPILPADHLFNTPIDALPVHPGSAAFMNTIETAHGSRARAAIRLHLDLGRSTDMSQPDTYWGIPYNVVHGSAQAWVPVRYGSTDPDMTWNPRPESDCANAGATGAVISPCLAAAAPSPVLPIPASPLVEGAIDRSPSQPYGDHHILVVDADTCRLWELYHCYPTAAGWDIYGSATFDLASSALRPETWTSADAAGFPILPLLLRADEASAGEIRHALRYTLPNGDIRGEYVWPARHVAVQNTGAERLPYGQLLRLKARYVIPAGFTTQAKAILRAMQVYGMYLSDGGSAMYVTGEPSEAWLDDTISQVATVTSADFEAVDLSPFTSRAGWSKDSARVPPAAP
jgi:hypothetical protein